MLARGSLMVSGTPLAAAHSWHFQSLEFLKLIHQCNGDEMQFARWLRHGQTRLTFELMHLARHRSRRIRQHIQSMWSDMWSLADRNASPVQ